jgi:hypothetical protein
VLTSQQIVNLILEAKQQHNLTHKDCIQLLKETINQLQLTEAQRKIDEVSLSYLDDPWF